MAAFSRLQLAAALLEYDNDPTNPDAPKRSAHDSAIFAHLRRNRPRKNDLLGVSFPSESGSLGGRESALDSRRSRSSVSALRNPFGADETVDDLGDDEQDDLEVDLSSWGLHSFIPKEKGSKNSRKKANPDALPHTRPVLSLRHRPDAEHESTQRRVVGARSMSLGYINSAGAASATWAAQPLGASESRPRSLGSLLDLASTEPSPMHFQRRPESSHGLIENFSALSPPHSIPFPSVSPHPDSLLPYSDDPHHARLHSELNIKPQSHERTYSTSSLGARMLPSDETQNPFAIRPPSRERASRFDPKSSHARTTSNATMATMGVPTDDNQFSVRPPSRASKFDPKVAAHSRTMSNASMSSRMLLENDGASITMGQRPDRPYSTLELLRPKVLVMPSPLQAVAQPSPPPPVTSREGFQLAADGPPLPPGARSARRNSATPLASNSFTPNPRISLTLSQLTFRNTLLVGGERDVAYSDIDLALPRATEEGEQVRSGSPVAEPPVPVSEEVNDGRHAGKYFGKSLIDDLESRKAQMRGKQRVFTGDERPSMMARSQVQRSSTLIDPATLHNRPTSHHMNPQGSQPALGRRNSANIKPFLTFDGDEQLPKTNITTDARNVNSRSVFGVDTIWEREMAKLQEIEATEKLEAEAEEIRKQQELDATKRKKGKRKGKGRAKSEVKDSEGTQDVIEQPARISADPPVLPSIQKATGRRPPPVGDDESDESEESLAEIPSQALAGSKDMGAARWFAGSSDEEDRVHRRTTGTGPRYTKAHISLADDDSEEDLPLAVAVERVAKRATQHGPLNEGSDEEKPLSVLLQKTKLSLKSSFDNLLKSDSKDIDDDDDDDEPLGLRASRVPKLPQTFNSEPNEVPDDDDRPLAFHPEQQRRTQYQMMAQQQQMLMQAQLQGSIFFGAPPGMMGPGYFGQPIPAPMLVPPPVLSMPSSPPPSLHDVAKFGRVDRWRRDVVVEGQL